MSHYSTGELANMFGLTKRTIQYYDLQHILKPAYIDDNQYRMYTEREVEQLRLILVMKSLGLTLKEIKQMLSVDGTLQTVRTLVTRKVEETEAEIRQQQQQLNHLLQQLDQKIQQEISNPNITLQKTATGSWWQLFRLERVEQPATDLMNRHVMLKEAQLRLLLASQALNQGQTSEYRKSVQEVIQLLVKLPDQNSQQIRSRLEKVLNLPAVPTPKLTTLGLLG